MNLTVSDSGGWRDLRRGRGEGGEGLSLTEEVVG